jgi:hypothetical protein
VEVFRPDMIKDLLDQVHRSSLITDVPESELIIRSMQMQKHKDLALPREKIFLDRDTP